MLYQQIFTLITLLSLLILINSEGIIDLSFIKNLKHKRVDYPIRFTYINRITKWWPPSQTLAQMAVPSYSSPHSYNYVALSFWTCQKGPIDVSKMWDDPIKFFGEQLGKSKQQVQQFLKKKYNNAGVSVILSAFGSAQKPTTLGLDPIMCARKLGEYVNSNNYDGVDIDFEDSQAMNSGKGQQWIINFMYEIRKVIPLHIISHAPQGPYFTSAYIGGGYRRIHKQVGHLIDFYNVQFYNQLNSTYDSYDLLFKKSDLNSPDTSISELKNLGGIPYDMLVVGKPASSDDVYNSGYTKPSDLVEYFIRANKELNWNTGFMFWQYHSDKEGSLANELSQVLKSFN